MKEINSWNQTSPQHNTGFHGTVSWPKLTMHMFTVKFNLQRNTKANVNVNISRPTTMYTLSTRRQLQVRGLQVRGSQGLSGVVRGERGAQVRSQYTPVQPAEWISRSDCVLKSERLQMGQAMWGGVCLSPSPGWK